MMMKASAKINLRIEGGCQRAHAVGQKEARAERPRKQPDEGPFVIISNEVRDDDKCDLQREPVPTWGQGTGSLRKFSGVTMLGNPLGEHIF